MKQLLFASVLMLLSISIFAQTPVAEYRVANSTTDFAISLATGSKIYNIATKEYWVANAAITAGVGVNIDSEKTGTGTGKLTLLTQLTLGDIGATTINIKTTQTVDASAPTGQLIALPSANGATNKAGLISGADQAKLNGITSGDVGVYLVESFPVTAPQTTVTLAQTPKNATAILVLVNGVPMKVTTQYSLAAKVVTIVPPLLDNDVVTVSYTY